MCKAAKNTGVKSRFWSVGEGKGGISLKNNIETYVDFHVLRNDSASLMYGADTQSWRSVTTGRIGWKEVGGGFRREGTHVYLYGQFMLMYHIKPSYYCNYFN